MSFFDNSYIYIDEFSGFTRQEYNVIKELLKKAKEIDITICSDGINIEKQPEEDIFYQKDKLQEAYVKPPLSTQIAQEVGIKKNILNMQELINCYK